MTAAEVRARAEHARDFLLTAQTRFEPGGPRASNNTTGLNAVNAGIAAADAICGFQLGYRSSGQDHKQAIALLTTALPRGNPQRQISVGSSKPRHSPRMALTT